MNIIRCVENFPPRTLLYVYQVNKMRRRISNLRHNTRLTRAPNFWVLHVLPGNTGPPPLMPILILHMTSLTESSKISVDHGRGDHKHHKHHKDYNYTATPIVPTHTGIFVTADSATQYERGVEPTIAKLELQHTHHKPTYENKERVICVYAQLMFNQKIYTQRFRNLAHRIHKGENRNSHNPCFPYTPPTSRRDALVSLPHDPYSRNSSFFRMCIVDVFQNGTQQARYPTT